MRFILIFLVLVSSASLFSKEKSQSLMIKMNQSYAGLKEEISFKKIGDHVLFATNSWNHQVHNSKSTELGVFKIEANENVLYYLELLSGYYDRLKNRGQGHRGHLDKSPHAVSISLNDQVINNNHAYFKQIKTMLVHMINEKDKICVKCARYVLKNKRISRYINGTFDKKFSLKFLNCKEESQGVLSCLDNDFGVFKLKK